MKTTVILILAIATLSLRSLAQCDEFIIYLTKGEVKVHHGAAAQTAQKNMKLTEGSSISLGKDAGVILLSGKDKALRLTTQGNFSMAEIRSTCMKNQSSLTKEYLNYVAKSIIDKGEPLTAMVIKGAVYRSRTEYEKTAMILPADSSVVTSDQVVFAWHPGAPEERKYLLIYENGVNEIYSKVLADTSVSIEAGLFKPQVIYFWLISDTSKPSDKEPRFTFIHGEHNWQNKVLDEWSATMKELEGQLDGLKQKMNDKKNDGKKP
ncbi:MAG: hypothetical protein NTY96_05310 [Bacteroidetes bacterium]|nr:hypothetical protein [Bacteroidota bacterium]